MLVLIDVSLQRCRSLAGNIMYIIGGPSGVSHFVNNHTIAVKEVHKYELIEDTVLT